jgi:hypothetical protein
MRTCCRPMSFLAASILVIGLRAPALAQSPPNTTLSSPAPPPPGKKTTRTVPKASKSANVKRGAIASIDATVGKLMLISAAGKTDEYELTEKTHYWKERRGVEASAFHVGDAVAVHLRHSRKTGLMQVTELDDPASWAWLDAMRHRITPVNVVSVDDDTLTVTVGLEKLPFTYVLNANTLWSRGGKSAQPAEFRPGETAYVVPRALPGGDVQARAVADNANGAVQLKERASVSVHGAIEALDAAAHTLTLTTATHDRRVLVCEADAEVLRGGKPLTWADLKTGQNVTARLRRREGEEPQVWRITIQSVRARTSRKQTTTLKKR